MKTTKNKRLINHKMTPASRERRAKDEGHSEPPNPDKGMSAFRQVTPLPVNHGKWTRHLNNADLFNSVTLAIRNGSNAIMDKMELIGGDKDADFEKFSIKYMNTKPTKQIDVVKAFLKATKQDISGTEPFLVYVTLTKQLYAFCDLDVAMPAIK